MFLTTVIFLEFIIIVVIRDSRADLATQRPIGRYSESAHQIYFCLPKSGIRVEDEDSCEKAKTNSPSCDARLPIPSTPHLTESVV